MSKDWPTPTFDVQVLTGHVSERGGLVPGYNVIVKFGGFERVGFVKERPDKDAGGAVQVMAMKFEREIKKEYKEWKSLMTATR